MKNLSDSIDSLQHMRPEIIQSLKETFIMMGLSTSVAVLFGGMMGIGLFLFGSRELFFNKSLYGLLGALTNFMRAFPFIILMIAMGGLTKMIVGTKIGPVAASVVLAVAGTFYFARLVEQNLKDVPKGIIEAVDSMGATPMTMIAVLLTEARSSLVLSITILCISLLSYSAAAGMIGGGGLGDLAVRYGYMRSRSEVTVFVVVILSVFVIIIQAMGNMLAKKLDKR